LIPPEQERAKGNWEGGGRYLTPTPISQEAYGFSLSLALDTREEVHEAGPSLKECAHSWSLAKDGKEKDDTFLMEITVAFTP
jgi:hypothetical protein